MAIGPKSRIHSKGASGKRIGEVRVKAKLTNAVDEALVLGDEVLIGQTVLEKLDLFVDCEGRRLVPNPAHPDQPVTKVK